MQDNQSINSSTSSKSSYDESVVNSIMFPDESGIVYKTVLYEELRLIERNENEINVCWKDESGIVYKTVLYEELRLIERNENEINVCWKGAHMMLFFMSCVFGSLCTCCIHRLKLMFGDECVLFPKLVTHSTVNRMVHEFFSLKTEKQELEPDLAVEFVATQWSENSVCYLPTYVPLVSGLSGLVWTTMFLMCSSGTTHNVTGAQRHWRALPIMFLFCATMAGLCIYTSTITHDGLKDLCAKLAHVTGSHKCGYSINVATLAYDRRIRGVYQATLLTIASAWLHTICWILSTLLIAARVLLAVDFTLVHVTAHLIGNVEDILQKYEKQINSLNAESAKPYKSDIDEEDSEVELYNTTNTGNETQTQVLVRSDRSIIELKGPLPQEILPRQDDSVMSLVPELRQRLIENYIRELIYKLLKNISKSNLKSSSRPHGEATTSATENTKLVTNSNDKSVSDTENIEKITKDIKQKLNEKLTQEFTDFEQQIKINLKNSSINRDTEITSKLEETDDKKNHENITDKLEHKKKEQDKSPGLPKESDTIAKDMQIKRSHTVQFNDEKLSEERKREGNKDENKQNIYEDIDKSRKRGALRISDDLKVDDILDPEKTITTKDHKHDEKKHEENKQKKSEDEGKPHISGELRILDDSNNSESVPKDEKTITTKDHKHDEKKHEENKQKKSEDEGKPHISGELRILDDSNNSESVPKDEKTITTKDHKHDEKKHEENKQKKSEDEGKPHISGELRILDDSNNSESVPKDEKTITTKDHKHDEKKHEENKQKKSEDEGKPHISGELRILDDSNNSESVPKDEKTITTKDHKHDEKKHEENKQKKSEDEGKPHISGELRILDDSNNSESVPKDEKTDKDQKQGDKK